MAVNPDKNIVEQSLIARLIGKIKRIALDISDDVSAEETRAMAAEAAAKTVVTAGENCSVTKTTASDGHDVYTIDADGKPQVQADWNQADSSKVDYIKNKPDLSLKEDVANKATTVRQSGSADDTHFPSEAAVRSAIDSAVSAAYKAAGTKRAAELTSSLLVAANEGNVYNITEAGTTDNNFVDGAGKTINVGDNVGVCKVGNDYKFDLLSGFVDLSDYLTKTGDGSNVTITPDGSSGTTFSSGGKLSELAQKFINLVSSLKALAFKDKVSDGDIDGVISASHIPDAIKDKIEFIDGTITRSGSVPSYTYSVTCSTTYAQVSQYLTKGKVPVCRFTLSATGQTWYFWYHMTLDNSKHSFGSMDAATVSDKNKSYITCVSVNTNDSWNFMEVSNFDDSYFGALAFKDTASKTDLSQAVRASLDNADSALQDIVAASGANIGDVGTPSVTASTDTTLKKTTLTFNYLKGANGTNGTSAYWFNGTAVTGTGTGISATVSGSKAGDMYLNSSTQDVYKATAANTWNYVCNIKGATGTWGGTVDKSYNASSTNPQSGTAVAQAVANKANTNGSYPDMNVGNAMSANKSGAVSAPSPVMEGNKTGYMLLATIRFYSTDASYAGVSGEFFIRHGNAISGNGILAISLAEYGDTEIKGRACVNFIRYYSTISNFVKFGAVRKSATSFEIWGWRSGYSFPWVNISAPSGSRITFPSTENVQTEAPSGWTEIPYEFIVAKNTTDAVGSQTRSVYAQPDGSLAACTYGINVGSLSADSTIIDFV